MVSTRSRLGGGITREGCCLGCVHRATQINHSASAPKNTRAGLPLLDAALPIRVEQFGNTEVRGELTG